MARDVRELARRSASAAKEIKLLIDTPNQHVQDGAQLVGETGNALQVIVAEVQEINRHVSAIVETAHEQSSGLKQIFAQFRLGDAAYVSAAGAYEKPVASPARTSDARSPRPFRTMPQSMGRRDSGRNSKAFAT